MFCNVVYVLIILLVGLQAILQDLFPGVEIPEHDYGKLQSAIEDCILAKGLQVRDLSTDIMQED